MSERDAYIGFSTFHGIGPLRFKLLLDYFKTAETAWNASEETLLEIGLGPKLAQKISDYRKIFSPKQYEKELLEKEIKIVTKLDSEYPPKLKEISDPPIALFVKGKLPSDWTKTIGIVGTRKVTAYGREVTVRLVRDLVTYGFTIVSGMARGVDGIAHRITLENQGITVAVLGAGVDIMYPPEHKELYSEILKTGAIISEVPPGHTVLRGLFPARNRIISGMSQGVVVTEGAEDSGSLITARLAIEQNREVFAVPGPITSYLSAGPTKLIKQGAKLVTEVGDILEELNPNVKIQISRPKDDQSLAEKFPNGELSKEAMVIFDLLSQSGEMHYDEIVQESKLVTSVVGGLITQLELAGIICHLGNGKYGLK